MGAGASLPELKDKDLEKLAKKNGLTKEGVKFFYNHYAVLQAKIKDPADMENRWMIEKLFDDLFPERETLTFGQYLETLMKFRSQSVDERAEFYFRILNYDKDTVINQADIAVFLQQISNYKFTPGDRVRIANGDDERTGILSFYGKTDFGKGAWAGITLDTPTGKNNGTVNGVKYFTCQPNYGAFVQSQFIRSEVFYKSSAAVLKAFDATGGITFDQFKQKVVEDKWLNSRVMFDPVKPEYLK